jgi:hypothetical protein
VPDADVQIIAHDNLGQPFLIRLSDLLPDANDPTNRSQDGDWLNASAIRLDALRQTLINEGYLVEGATLWWSPHALDTIDLARLGAPRDGETRLTSMNLVSTVRRAIGMYYPSHRQPCPGNQDGDSPITAPATQFHYHHSASHSYWRCLGFGTTRTGTSGCFSKRIRR